MGLVCGRGSDDKLARIKVRFKGHLKALDSVGYLGRGSGFSSRVRPNWPAPGSFRARKNFGQQGGLPPGDWSFLRAVRCTNGKRSSPRSLRRRLAAKENSHGRGNEYVVRLVWMMVGGEAEDGRW